MHDQRLIRDHIEEYYANLYTETMPHKLKLEGVEFDVISGDQ